MDRKVKWVELPSRFGYGTYQLLFAPWFEVIIYHPIRARGDVTFNWRVDIGGKKMKQSFTTVEDAKVGAEKAIALWFDVHYADLHNLLGEVIK